MVSVIIPLYNSEKTALASIESVMDQDHKDLEIICVDDGSRDATYPLLRGCSLRDKRIRIIRQENAGPGAARNRGIEESKGDFITFLDGDDTIAPDLIGALVRSSGDSDLVMGGFMSILSEHPEYPVDICSPEPFSGTAGEYAGSMLMEMLKDDSAYLIGSKLYRAEMLKNDRIRFDSGYRICEDALFSVSAMAAARRISVIPNTGYHYISYSGRSLSSGYDGKGIEANSALYLALRDNFGEQLDRGELDAYFIRRYIGQLLRIYSMSDLKGEDRFAELERVLRDPVLNSVLSEGDLRKVKGASFRLGAGLLKHGKHRAFHRLCCFRYGRKEGTDRFT